MHLPTQLALCHLFKTESESRTLTYRHLLGEGIIESHHQLCSPKLNKMKLKEENKELKVREETQYNDTQRTGHTPSHPRHLSQPGYIKTR